MCVCEFCSISFQARAQVKRPRACPRCQGRRQRANEKAWHGRHPEYGDKQYHQIQKKVRLKRLGEVVAMVVECLKVGKDFLKQDFDIEITRAFLSQFLAYVGIREINKVWPTS